MRILNNMSIKNNDLQNIVDKMAKENKATEEMIIDDLKRWLEKYNKK